MKKNDIVELSVEDLTTDGKGIGRAGGFAVFVNGALPGEFVRAVLIVVKKSYAVGKLLDILTPSPLRAKPPCGVFMKCGGCSLQHLSYPAQLEYKQKHVISCMERIAKLDAPVLFPLPSKDQYRYRNKAAFPIQMIDGYVNIGFYAQHSHHAVDISDCKIQPASIAVALSQLRVWITRNNVSVYDESTGTGLLRHAVFRTNRAGGIMLILVVNGEGIPNEHELISLYTMALPRLKTIVINHNREDTNVIMGGSNTVLTGQGCFYETILGLDFRIGPSTFLQVNISQAEALYNTLFSMLDADENDVVLDLYCGAGAISLNAAKRAKSVVGIEISGEAVSNAELNAGLNGIENVRFICGDAKELLTESALGLKPDIIIADPPRKGLDEGVIDSMAALMPRSIAYVSCDPATFARDLAIFAGKGYLPSRIQPVDMFPQTTHVECLTVLYKVNG